MPNLTYLAVKMPAVADRDDWLFVTVQSYRLWHPFSDISKQLQQYDSVHLSSVYTDYSFSSSFIYLYPFFRNSPSRQTRWCIFMLDGSNNAESSKGVPFGSRWHCSSFWGQSHQKLPFCYVNRHFKPNWRIIKFAIISKQQIRSPWTLATIYRSPNSLREWSRIFACKSSGRREA